MFNNDNKILNLLKRAKILAELSPDPKTKVGSILVSKQTNSVIAEGYNGFLRKINDDEIPLTRPAIYDFIIHSELNLLLNCCRNGISTLNCAIFQTHSPCIQCARSLYQAGITDIYFKEYYPGTDKIKELEDLPILIQDFGKYSKMVLNPPLINDWSKANKWYYDL